MSIKIQRLTPPVVVLATVLLAAVAKGQPGGDIPFVPNWASISIQTNGPSVIARVTVAVPSTCKYASTWGVPSLYGTTIIADAQFWTRSGFCAQIMTEIGNNYDLGFLLPGDYTFTLQSWGTPIASQPFTVPDRDTDGDGMLDSQEVVVDTNPQSASSTFRVLGVKPDVNTNGAPAMRITWQGGTQARQVLLRSSSPTLSLASWTPIFTNLPPTAITNSYLDATATNSFALYRLQADRP